ncbi:DNA topoisomerase 3 [Halomonas elongata]|uniref:DNA topoisomerase 3 n=1 Tax=Halomonas elongata TaxID=2746 RepID=UPI00255AD588|nr:DNA topoisomerase 3 [Halomonas elongata]MDL4860732.1 DNA topoisomerase 3 [Halomonas elongata]
MRVFVAEKPELGRAIAEALGGGKKEGGCIRCNNDDVVTWCFGHLLTLTDPEDHDPAAKQWAMERLPMSWPIKHKPLQGKSDQIQLIKKLVGKADTVVHAGDPDDEGQLLVDEVLQYVGNTAPVQRILINDNNTKIVKRALDSLRDNREFHGLYQSALARSVADQRYGYNLTRCYTLGARAAGADHVLSVGRVQTPILGLVVRRDRAHEGHASHVYYDLGATFAGEGGAFAARYRPGEGAPVDDKGRVVDQEFAQRVAQAIEGQPARVVNAKTEDKQTPPPLPYNLLNLQADASRKFGFSPDKTLKTTQALRERHRLITYNRSDCEYLSDEQHADAPGVLDAIGETAPVLGKAAQAADPSLKSRAYNSANVSAHHAIIPTQTSGDLDKLTDDEAKLYQLIARQFVAQHWPPEQYRQTTLDLEVAGHAFRVTAKVVTSPGWKRLYKQDADNEEVHGEGDDSAANLEWVTANTPLTCQGATVAEKKTQPPKRYTMATLLKDLARVARYVTDPRIKQLLLAKDQEIKGEHGGIGTATTRSAIIEALMKRGFIEERSKKVLSTKLGREFHDLLPESATAPDMTALWHEQQEQIRKGEMSLEQFVDGVAKHVAAEIERIKAKGVDIKATAGPKCPECGEGELRRRKGSNGYFWGCSRHPECKATRPDSRGKPGKKKAAAKPSSEHMCPKCGKGLVRRPGKNKGSHWWGCSGFPKCDFRAHDNNGKPKVGDGNE